MSKDNWSNISEDDGEAPWDSFMDWEDKDTDVRNDGAEDEYGEDLIFPIFLLIEKFAHSVNSVLLEALVCLMLIKRKVEFFETKDMRLKIL